jgi:hypothetical protein
MGSGIRVLSMAFNVVWSYFVSSREPCRFIDASIWKSCLFSDPRKISEASLQLRKTQNRKAGMCQWRRGRVVSMRLSIGCIGDFVIYVRCTNPCCSLNGQHWSGCQLTDRCNKAHINEGDASLERHNIDTGLFNSNEVKVNITGCHLDRDIWSIGVSFRKN